MTLTDAVRIVYPLHQPAMETSPATNSTAPADIVGASRVAPEVGFHDFMPARVYHADPCPTPSLSSGVARTLIEKTPAHAYAEHVRLGARRLEATPEMTLGSYVHGLLSDQLDEFVIGNFDNYQTKAAREWRDGVEAMGKTPILEKTSDRAVEIMQALRAKAAVGLTSDPFTAGKPEVTALWQEDGYWFRARYDRLILDEGGFADVWDWKTTGGGVSNRALLRTILDRGYHIQAAHYLRGLRAVAPRFAGRTSFIFAFVETAPPYAVRRVVLSEGFLSLASSALNRAIDTWRHCLSANTWPDESAETLTLEPPAWLEEDDEITVSASA